MPAPVNVGPEPDRVRPGEGDRGAVRVQHFRRGRCDFVDRHRLDQRRQPLIVVEPEAELLAPSAGSAAMLSLVSSIRGIDPTRNSRGFVDLDRRRTVGAELPHFRVDRRERALDVPGIDAGADDERASPIVGSNELKA